MVGLDLGHAALLGPQERFIDALSPGEQRQLKDIAANAQQPPPPDWVRWLCGSNGFTSEGHMWCGRRALSKATDLGMLDNVTAGGLLTCESALNSMQASRVARLRAALVGWPTDAR
jgi:hypothetical protein